MLVPPSPEDSSFYLAYLCFPVVRAWSLHPDPLPKLRALRIRRARGFDGIGRFPIGPAIPVLQSPGKGPSFLGGTNQNGGKTRAKRHPSAFFGRDSEWAKSNKEVTSKTLKRAISATCPELVWASTVGHMFAGSYAYASMVHGVGSFSCCLVFHGQLLKSPRKFWGSTL